MTGGVLQLVLCVPSWTRLAWSGYQASRWSKAAKKILVGPEPSTSAETRRARYQYLLAGVSRAGGRPAKVHVTVRDPMVFLDTMRP